MKSKNEENEPIKQVQEIFAEIGQILYAGIRRLKERELSKNIFNQLDYATKKSVHEANNNLNQGGL